MARGLGLIVLALSSSGALLACGGSAGEGTGDLAVSFELFRGGANVPCSEATEVRRVEARLFAGATAVAGFPRDVDCASGRFELRALPAGSYTVELVARGEVGGEADAALFRARSTVEIPGAGEVSLSLKPEVAYLTLTWTFGEEGLAPCGNEVASVGVIVSAGGSQAGAFRGTFPCTGTPLAIPQPFALQSYTIRLDANSAEGFPLYSLTDRRLLDRGQNSYAAVLAPLGGRLYLDWEFALGMERTRDCSGPSVRVGELRATVRSLEGGQSVVERISCAEPRPYALKASRFTEGRRLEVELLAEGERHQWRSVETFVMPSRDRAAAPAALRQVGTATVSFTVSSTCAGAMTTGYRVRVVDKAADRGAPPTLEADLAPDARVLGIPYLVYGEYGVRVQQLLGRSVGCSVEGSRTIRARRNDWDALRL
jgi:hypothetical protein